MTNALVQTLAEAFLPDWYCSAGSWKSTTRNTAYAIESLQFTTEQALQPAIAFLSVVTLWLQAATKSRVRKRRPKPATAMFLEQYVEVLLLDR